ncbi:DUF3298 domain-containing protein [Sporosarcina sp. PTS2304]|uniref:polysaccharide deacetylase family protein n=1 Tax=Sporosarcina sp. PTS2304 TaxID=2283194 RepID=UPI000E0DED6B|nr:polysaccharide deacetylase family protein [Sporosarcina sp. PTS2304]AXH99414.1 DUF3298 domain-containing protein [Sporosarcina sp. PTS2304]
MKKDNKRKRRMRLINIGFLSVITILTITVLFLIIHSFTSSTSASPNRGKHQSADRSKTEVNIHSKDSSIRGINIVTETMDDQRMPFSIQYPKSEFENFNQEVAVYIKSLKKDYQVLNENSSRDTHGRLNVTFETIRHSTGYLSFVLHATKTVSNEDSIMEVRTFHLNPETGIMPTMADVVNHNAENLKRIAKIVRDQIYENTALQNSLIIDSVWQPTEPIWANYRNFALTDDELILYYATGVMTKRQAGPVQIEIPWKDINPYVAKEFQVDHVVERQEKKIALTFDDGPDPHYTEKILKTLEKYDVKATFFMLGNRVQEYPEIARMVADAGHEIGNHSWNHPPLPNLTDEDLHHEVQGTEEAILQATGQHATVFRPPYGAVDQRVRESSKLPVVLWNVDTLDWEHLDPEKLLESIKTDLKENSIVLMHDIHESTAEGLEAVLEFLKSQNYTFVPVSEMENY